MRIALDTLPTDITLLHQLVRDMADGIDSRDTEIEASKQALTESQLEIDRLVLIIKQFQRARFGRSAERLDPEQMVFGLEELEADLARAEASRPQPAPAADDEETASVAKPAHRAPLPAHLPRAERVIPASHAAGDACPDCGGVLHDAGATHSEMLDWVPASIRVLRVTRPKCACRACGTLHQALAPARIVPGGLATPGLVAHVLISRYCDHLPLFRQSRILARHGLAISRSTLSGWVVHPHFAWIMWPAERGAAVGGGPVATEPKVRFRLPVSLQQLLSTQFWTHMA